MAGSVLTARNAAVVFIALAFLSISANDNEDQPEQYTTLDTINGQLVTANLRRTSNLYHYLAWAIATCAVLALTVHFSSGEAGGALNVVVMLLVLVCLLFFLRYLYATFRSRV
jgi:hypothetical protein